MSLVRAFMAVVGVSLAALGLPAAAGANNLQTLDPDAVSPGHVAQDAAGNAYVSWTSEGVGTGPEPVRFCKVPPGGACAPISLPIPGATSLSDSASAAIPVLGPGDTVYVVAPRYAPNDLVFWTSTNGGASFGGGTLRSFYSNKTRPTDAFLSGSTFLIGAYNPGLGFSTAEIAGVGGGSFSFADPGSVASSSMGLAAGNPVIAYWNLEGPQYPLQFYRYKGSGSLTADSNWAGPSKITNGYEPSLAGGPAGLFLVSQDYTGGQYPDAINVRRFEGTSFGPPRTLAVDPAPSLFIGGAIAQSTGGSRIAVAWPGNRAGDNAYVMRLFSSADGGATYSQSDIAHIGVTYAIHDNADLAVGDSGAGWIVFTDNNGLQLADLTPIAALPSGPEKLPGPYKGKTKTISKQVGAFLITLRLPKSCVQSRQRFFAGVGKRKRKALSKKLGGKLKLKKVTFFFDGRKLRVKKRKPFRYLIDPGVMAPGSTHKVKVRVTATLTKGEKKKRIKRTLEGTITAC